MGFQELSGVRAGWDGMVWDGMVWDGTGRDGTGRDGTGQDGTGRDGMVIINLRSSKSTFGANKLCSHA